MLSDSLKIDTGEQYTDTEDLNSCELDDPDIQEEFRNEFEPNSTAEGLATTYFSGYIAKCVLKRACVRPVNILCARQTKHIQIQSN